MAQEHQFTCGKWMTFCSPEKADEVWYEIAIPTANGRLGCSARSEPFHNDTEARSPLCCVYVEISVIWKT